MVYFSWFLGFHYFWRFMVVNYKSPSPPSNVDCTLCWSICNLLSSKVSINRNPKTLARDNNYYVVYYESKKSDIQKVLFQSRKASALKQNLLYIIHSWFMIWWQIFKDMLFITWSAFFTSLYCKKVQCTEINESNVTWR